MYAPACCSSLPPLLLQCTNQLDFDACNPMLFALFLARTPLAMLLPQPPATAIP